MVRRHARRLAAALAAVAGMLAFGAPADANILAAVEQPASGGRSDLDIALYDATTGARLSLPASVDTTDDELHPSLTPDGRLLVFERSNPATGTHRIVIVNLSTGASADLFSGFEAAQVPPATPAISADGKTVITGRQTVAGPDSSFHHLLTATDVSSFPSTTTGPFPHQTIDAGVNGTGTGQTLEPALGPSGLLAYEARVPELSPGLDVKTLGGSGPDCGLDDGDAELSQPALAASSTTDMLFTHRSAVGAVHPGDVWFAPLAPNSSLCDVSGAPARLPALVNSLSQDESRPALTPDGRYVAFVRHQSDSNGHSVLLVWDSLTQTLVNTTGIDLGVLTPREIDLTAARGNLSVRVSLVLQLTSVSLSGVVSAQLVSPASIGILVQRVVGHHLVLGRRAPRLRLVGRVPLGHFTRGHKRIRWNHKVNGRSLPPGLYQVTVRALAPNRRIEDLGAPHLIRIRRTRTPG
jgi:WD40-like Beta Propeller Repeat